MRLILYWSAIGLGIAGLMAILVAGLRHFSTVCEYPYRMRTTWVTWGMASLLLGVGLQVLVSHLG